MREAFLLLRALVAAGSAELAERVVAEAHAAGASGLEEREGPRGIELLVFAPAAAARAVEGALRALALAAPPGALDLSDPEPVAEVAWEERWKDGLTLLRISPRLSVRPPFVPDGGSGAVVIEPGQAFGTGGHASTRLALAALDALAAAGRLGRVLDVGTGSGVLALAALRLGAERAVGFDLDPLAAPAARRNARANDAGAALLLFTGPIDALAPRPFDVVLANLLRSELLPVLPALARALPRGGYAILSGLLAPDAPGVRAALARLGLRVEAEREECDADGTPWICLTARRDP